MRHIQHGKVNTREYRSWRGMIERCENKNHKQFADYGGRGIRVCTKWRKSFLDFLADMGICPEGCSIERENNAKGYTPSNCFWATRKQQARNKRNNRLLTAFGKTKTLAAWAEEYAINYGTILSRIDRDGLSVEQALTRGNNEPRKNTHWLTCNGVTRTITEWALRLKTSRSTITGRLNSGMTEHDALTLPITRRKHRNATAKGD